MFKRKEGTLCTTCGYCLEIYADLNVRARVKSKEVTHELID